MGAFERVLYFVIDQGILAKYLTQDPRRKVKVKDSEGQVVTKALRECMTINVYPVPLAAGKNRDKPLSATTAAAEAFIMLNEISASNGGKHVLRPDQRAALLNAGFKEDGIGIEVFGDAFVSPSPEAPNA